MTVAVAPTLRVVAEALTARLVTATPDASTVMPTEALCPPNMAVIVAVPTAWAVTIPAALTVATDELLDPHVALTFALVPSP